MTGPVFRTLVFVEDTVRKPQQDCLKVSAKDAVASCQVPLTKPRSLLGDSVHFGTRQRLPAPKVKMLRTSERRKGTHPRGCNPPGSHPTSPCRNKSRHSRPHEPLECLVLHILLQYSKTFYCCTNAEEGFHAGTRIIEQGSWLHNDGVPSTTPTRTRTAPYQYDSGRKTLSYASQSLGRFCRVLNDLLFDSFRRCQSRVWMRKLCNLGLEYVIL